MKQWMKMITLLLALTLMCGILAACAEEDPEETSAPTQTQTETTEETEPTGGIVGENDVRLNVEYETPGVIAADAAPLGSKKLVVNGLTVEMPIQIAALLSNGWAFYSEETAQMPVAAKTETNVMGFSLYLEETAYLDITVVSNSADTKKPISECTARRLVIDLDLEDAAELEIVLPGGITQDSTSADVLAVYGDVLENPNFEYVQVGKKMLYYVGNLESGLNYYFGFNDDGTLNGVTISCTPSAFPAPWRRCCFPPGQSCPP